MKFTLTSNDESARCLILPREENGITYVDVKVHYDKPTVPSRAYLKWQIPCAKVYSTWGPNAGFTRSVLPEWAKNTTASRLAYGAPVQSLVSVDGKNTMTVAVSDARTPLQIRTGVIEENACMDCVIELFTFRINAITDYSATVRIDMRDISFFDAVYSVHDWWENEFGYKCAYVPDAARLPMNSSWYSFHQRVSTDEIIRQCELSKPLGMDTIIIDDGWQTDDNSRGYAYCGDWEIASAKIPDIHDLVKRIHNVGMKVMFWYTVPFVGKYSKVYDSLKDMTLGESYSPDWLILDPRYPEVRKFLVEKYSQAIEEWELDGLKLDFIDTFQLQSTTPTEDERRDCASLEDGVERLLEETINTLTAINPEVLIEFRQKYMGPTICKYSNMMRVCDCPNDAATNRIGIVDLRLTSGKTAVHSDMLMWNYNEPTEHAALQITNVLFGVPQISVLIDKLSEEHKKMLGFYLGYWREHRELLLDGYLTARHAGNCYSLIQSEKDGEIFAVAHAESMLTLDKEYKKIFFVNACGDGSLFIRAKQEITLPYRIINCCGEEIKCGEVKLSQIPTEFAAPLSAIVEIG